MGGFEGSSLGLVLVLLFDLDLFLSTPPSFPSTHFLFLLSFILSPFLFSFIWWWRVLLESRFRVCSAAHAMFLVLPPTDPIEPSLEEISHLRIKGRGK